VKEGQLFDDSTGSALCGTVAVDRVVLDLSAYPGLMEALERAAYDDVSSIEQWALRCVKAKLEVKRLYNREEHAGGLGDRVD